MKTYVFFQRSIIFFFIVLFCKTDLYAQDFSKFQYKIGATATYDFSTSVTSGFGVSDMTNYGVDINQIYLFNTYSLGNYALTQQFYFKKWFLNLDVGATFIQNKASYVIDFEGLDINGSNLDKPAEIYFKTLNVFLVGSLTFNRYFEVGEKAGLSVGLGFKLSHFITDSKKNSKYMISGEFEELERTRYLGDEELGGFHVSYYRSRYTNNFLDFFTPVLEASYFYHFTSKHTLFFKGSLSMWDKTGVKNELVYFLHDENGINYINSIRSNSDTSKKGPIFSLSVGYTFGVSK